MILESFRPGGAVANRVGKPSWAPPDPGRYPTGVLLCFDQSIAATGWVCVMTEGTVLHSTQMNIVDVGKVGRLANGDKSIGATLDRATEVAGEIDAIVEKWSLQSGLKVVHEAPPAGGSKMMNPESSMLTALAVRIACASYNLPVFMIGAQKAKYVLTGNRTSEKKDIKIALDRLDESTHIHGYNKVKNAAQRDALALAHAWLSEHPR